MVNMPRPKFLRSVAGIKFEMSSFSGYKCKISLYISYICYVLYVLL